MAMDTCHHKETWVVSGVLMNQGLNGAFLGFTSFLLAALRDPQSEIQADLELYSWIAGAYSFGVLPGFIISSYFLNRFGRRLAFIFNLIPGTISFILIYFATNVYHLMLARVLEGIAVCSTTGIGAIVIGEYTSPAHRGMFLNLKTAAFSLGSTIVHVLGSFYHWKTVALILLVPNLMTVAMVWTWPESPAWLAAKQKFEKSEKLFYYLRGKNEDTMKELTDMIKTQQSVVKCEKYLSFYEKINYVYRKVTKINFLKPALILLFTRTLLEATGRHIFPAFAAQILAEVSSPVSSFYSTLCMDVIITLSALFSSVLVRIFKMRTLLFTTGAVSIAVLMLLCGYLFLVSKSLISNVSWIPLTLFGAYLALITFGCVPITLGLVGELFPLEHRAAGNFMTGLTTAVTVGILFKSTPLLLDSVKLHGTFSIYGVIMVISLVFLYFMLPETKDKTLQEIEDHFKSDKQDDKDCEADIEESEMLDDDVHYRPNHRLSS